MSDDKNVKTERPRVLVVDEYSNFFGGLNDTLKEELRKVSGVPNATYLVNDGKVFVFDKLVHLVKERQKDQPDLPLADLARSLIAEATVSAKDAVEAWGVVPVPYETEKVPTKDIGPLDTQETGFLIRHRPFNAQLPGEFRDESDVKTTCANILLGGIHPGSGNFTYRGQAMTLLEPLDLTLLPERPAIQEGPTPESWGYTALANVGFEAGFEPVSEVMFNRVKELEAGWRANIARAAKHAQAQSAEVWAQAVDLRLEALNDPSDEV